MPEQPIKELWDGFWQNASQTDNQATAKFAIQPVKPEEFFKLWLKTPLFPRQQRAVNAAFNRNFTSLNEAINKFVLAWGKGCISATTLLKDEITKETKTVKEWMELNKSINIKTCRFEKDKTQNYIRNKFDVIQTGIPFKAGETELFEVTLENGKKIQVSGEHQFKVKDGWAKLKDLKIGDSILVDKGKPQLSEKQEKVRRQKIADTTRGKSKSPEHRVHIKNSNNPGRFKLGTSVWNKGIPCAKNIKIRIRQKLLGKKLPLITRLRMSIANKGLNHHKPDCQCSCCKARRGEINIHPRVYKNNYMRSSWEVAFAKYLDKHGLHWQYEPKQFQLSSGEVYIPDFYIVEHNKWIELKGFWTHQSQRKIALFKKEFDVNFEILRKNDLQALGII